MFELIRHDIKFDFVGKRYWYLGLSVLMILGTFALLATKGLNYGIDFTGGAEVRVSAPQEWEIGKFRDALEKGGIKEARVLEIGATPGAGAANRLYLIRTQGGESELAATSEKVGKALDSTIGSGKYEVQSADVVGPAAGKLLRRSGFLSMFYALLVILVYVGMRFDFRYAPGAVLALFHDVVLVVGIFILTQKQFDLTILAAVLALIGYSNNDTIIVFDRVRETLGKTPNVPIEQVVNTSVNQTLGRTIVTSLCTFLVAASLWVFGGSVIENFAFTFMVGIAVGTYSSVFIATSLVIELTHLQMRRNSKVNVKKDLKLSPESLIG